MHVKRNNMFNCLIQRIFLDSNVPVQVGKLAWQRFSKTNYHMSPVQRKEEIICKQHGECIELQNWAVVCGPKTTIVT